MVNYDKSTIYKLCCKDPEITDIYVGSTTNFSRRKTDHKSNCYNENGRCHHLKVYKTIRDFGGWNNWDMVEIERYCATDKKDLHSRERFWLEELGATLNKVIPTRSDAEQKAEYRAKNKDKINEYYAKYYAKNKDKIAEQHAKNKDKIAEQHAEWYAKNKDKIAEKGAEYYAKNKEKYAEKIQCECGSEVNKSSLPRHRKTKKHQKWVEQNSELL